MSLTDARMSSLEDKIVAQAEAAKKEKAASRKEKIKKLDKSVEEIKDKPKKK